MPEDPTDRKTDSGAASEIADPSDGTETQEGAESKEEEYLDEPADTPFDHPLFLPAILAALWVWFGYDGFINQDPDMLEHLSFNRGGFAVLTVATAWFGYKGWREISERTRDRGDTPEP